MVVLVLVMVVVVVVVTERTDDFGGHLDAGRERGRLKIKRVTRTRTPRQISLSEAFIGHFYRKRQMEELNAGIFYAEYESD
ncbi:hypothetical protein M0804_015526 [Polistes exclamans]|nr:hypothetical protein M0804_015527 [Polistes exclamans]KAI4473008.1 hypothetical protein M0804_015526 [Polistes exclamans]